MNRLFIEFIVGRGAVHGPWEGFDERVFPLFIFESFTGLWLFMSLALVFRLCLSYAAGAVKK